MKKALILLAVVPIIFLSACDESSYISVDVFSKRINDSFGYEIFDKDKLIIISENDSDVYYWFPEEYDNLCISLKCTKDSGVITEYSAVYSGEYNKRPDDFFKNIETAVNRNNKYIIFDEYKRSFISGLEFGDSITHNELRVNVVQKSKWVRTGFL